MTPNDILVAKAETTQRAVVARIWAAWEAANDTNREDGAQWYLLAGNEVERMAPARRVSSARPWSPTSAPGTAGAGI
jgi:hypothetical protein